MDTDGDPDVDAAGTSLLEVSKSRLRVLRTLRDGRQTVSELAREVELNKSTVHSHVQDLVEEGLVDRHEDERLWVYYSLTDRGRRLVGRDRLRLVVDLSTVLAFLGSLALLGYRFLWMGEGRPTGTGGGDPGPWAPPPTDAGIPVYLVGAAVLLLLAIAGWWLHRHLVREGVAVEPH